MPAKVLITARSPLTFAPRKPGEQFTPSLGYVPGSVLWGAVGFQLNAMPGARYENALPAREGDAWVRVIPESALSCKNPACRGFRAEGSERHGVFDTLIDRVSWEELDPAALAYNPHCPACGGRATAYSGFYAMGQDGKWHRRSVQHRMLTRVAIDRRRSTSAETLLYSPIVISEMTMYRDGNEMTPEPTRFLGWVHGLANGPERADDLAAIHAIGGRTSSGLGQVQVEVQPTESEGSGDLAQRLSSFNQYFTERWRVMQALKPQQQPGWSPGDWRLFTVGLQSDAILLEAGWQPTTIFSAEQLAQHTGLEATFLRAQVSSTVVGGWNVRWNQPKPTSLAARAGGIFVFRTQASSEKIVAALSKLEAEGIGHRREEGFGAVRCCDEFHVRASKEAV